MQTIDASKSIEEVHEEIKATVTTIIENIKDQEIGRLWVNSEAVRPGKRPCPEGAVDRQQSNGKFLGFVFVRLFDLFVFFLYRVEYFTSGTNKWP